MTVLRKWDYGKHEYVPLEVPDGWHVSCYEADMDAAVNCCRCGRALPFGETYTSLQVHAPVSGFGYAVCPECYEMEMEKEVRGCTR